MLTSREIVHTITDYYDGPRGGIADYHGKPHIYNSMWDEATDDWAEYFALQPIDDETFRLAMEDWAIWERWERAFKAGLTTYDTHPALPEDRSRQDELNEILKPRLLIDMKRAIRVRGRFEKSMVEEPGLTSGHKFVVVWSEIKN